jgi:hypothetical protein
MNKLPAYTTFIGDTRLAGGTPWEVALAVKAASKEHPNDRILTFDNHTGRPVDFDLRGSDDDIIARLASPEPSAAPSTRAIGRPKLGVVAREVTLLPRQWEWLTAQSGGASAALRKLVDAARRADAGQTEARQAQEATDRFMLAMLGDRPGYEEASRALYAADAERFAQLIQPWPVDLREHVKQLAALAFSGDSTGEESDGPVR